MSKILSQVTKIHHGSHPGNVRRDERPRNSLPRPPIHIAPRPFTYDILQPGEIRLLDISPSEDRSTPVRVELRHQPLRFRTYEALSHACEKEELGATIEVNGQPFSVSGSLLEALRDIRSEKKNRTLWIDSICINQNDVEEKGKQARLKADVFNHATVVISWPRDKGQKQDAHDDTVLERWLIPSGTLSPPALDGAHARAGGVEGEHSFNLTSGQIVSGSPPALSFSPRSPQTTLASSSPGSSTDTQSEACLEGMTYQLAFSDGMPYELAFRDDPLAVSMDIPDLQRLLSGDESMGSMFSTSPRKRSLEKAFSGDLSAPCNRKAQQTQPITGDANDRGPNVVFACPFHRSNPQKYQRCLKYTLNRIKDVKQHIYRQHSRPTLYCARCYEIFTTTGDRDVHSRRADCEKRDPPQFEGITEQQRNELKKSSPKKKPLDEQWFELWEVLFPGRQRPQSAFIRNYVEETVPLLRNLWDEKKAEIISGVMATRSGHMEVDRDLIATIMGSVFDRFEAEATRSPQGSRSERSEPRADSLMHAPQDQSGFEEPGLCFDFHAALDQQGLSEMGMDDFNTGCAVDLGNFYTSQSVVALFGTESAP